MSFAQYKQPMQVIGHDDKSKGLDNVLPLQYAHLLHNASPDTPVRKKGRPVECNGRD